MGKKSAALMQQLDRVRHEQRTDEEAMEQVRLKGEELAGRQQQLREQRLGNGCSSFFLCWKPGFCSFVPSPSHPSFYIFCSRGEKAARYMV